jgi:hypothetical protein
MPVPALKEVCTEAVVRELESLEPGPPVAARETARALARVRRAARRRRLFQTAVLVISLVLLGVGGLAYYQHAHRARLDPCPGEWPVWGHCMRTTQLFDTERPFLQFCGKHRDLMRVCIRKKTCEEFRACARSTVEHWRRGRTLAAD